MRMNVRKFGYRYQRKLWRPTGVVGIGFLTGAPIRLRFAPSPPSTGVVFVRTDLQQHLSVAAHVSMVSGTQRRTTLGRPPAQVALVEHVLAALAGMRVDNCLVELNGPEPPGLDGSAQQFVDAIRRTGAAAVALGDDEPEPVLGHGAHRAAPDERDECA